MKRFEILFEDNHLLFAKKPSGRLTQPTESDSESLEQDLKAYIKEKYNKPGNVYLHAVHRLDRKASGIVLFAKTSKALSRANELIRDHKIKKEYFAIVSGELSFTSKKETLISYLKHGSHRALCVDKSDKSAKRAELFYTPVTHGKSTQLLHIELTTGRYHQIRAQLAHLGHPILGDEKYGSKEPFFPDAIALHHAVMTLEHPVTCERLCIKASPPEFWPPEAHSLIKN